MPVTFGTVEVIPHPSSAATSASSGGAAEKPASPAIDPRDLAPALRNVMDREARVRAH
ncbi:MAG TPA: hypothetical protein VGD80_01085 [Kofleriaceae bacterium]